MNTEKKPGKRLYSLAAAIGLALGSMGVAAAASTPARPAPAQQESPAVTTDQVSSPTDEATEAEAETPGDEAADGVDDQFEGEEVGNNGDGLADANEASEVEGDEADEVEAPGDEAADGVDHQFEGEEIGNNGDGIPDANEAAETPEAGTNG